MVAIDMDFPKRCEECRFLDKEIGGCSIMHCFTLRMHGQEKPSWCPLIEIPKKEEHPRNLFYEQLQRDSEQLLTDGAVGKLMKDGTWVK